MKERIKGRSLIEFPDSYVVLDIETTGFDPNFDEIIELAGIKYTDRVETARFDSLVRPENAIGSYITMLTGITNDMVADAPRIADILPGFLDFVGDAVIVGHNVGFDINFLYDNAERLGLAPVTNDFVNTMRLSRRLCKDLERHDLESLAEHLGVEIENRHRALGDSQITACCFEKMRTMAEALGGIPKLDSELGGRSLKARDIVAETADFDPDSPIFGKVFAFTGALEHFTRAEAMQKVANAGGTNGSGVTRETNYLVLGNTDYCAALKGGKSAKHKKAEALALKGQDIKIISENVFLDMLAENAG